MELWQRLADRELPFGGLGLLPRAIGADRHERVELASFLDARERGVDRLDRRDLFGPDRRGELRCGQIGDVGHACILFKSSSGRHRSATSGR